MAEALVSVATQMLIEEAKYTLGMGAADEVEYLKEELMYMQAFLKDAYANAHKGGDERVHNLITKVIDSALDMEDVIETYAVKVASRRREGIINVFKRFATICSEVRAVREVSSEIKRIKTITENFEEAWRKEFDEEAWRRKIYEEQGRRRQREIRWTSSPIGEQNVVGLEGNIKELVTNLVAEDKHFRVLSIYGMGGLGKTTLALQIYHHGEVRGHFEYLAWVCVSQNCRTREVWEGILFSLTSLSGEPRDEIINMTDDQLAPKLHQILKEKKCLVVLDDIWSIQDWNSLSVAFPKEEETSTKILLTSRNKEVASHADPRGFHLELQCLNDEESWELLQQRAIFGRHDFKVDEGKEELAKAMLKHCAGLPLAISVLGGILAGKYSLNDWQMVHKNIKRCLLEDEIVSSILALSYNDLQTGPRLLFLYLSHFPENSEINVDKLIRLWVAEGFTTVLLHDREEKEEEESMEDVAEGYLNELIARSMVLVGERDASLRTKTCRMHVLMRDFCLLKAKQEDFLFIIDYLHVDENIGPSSFSSTIIDYLHVDENIGPSSSSSTSHRLAVHLHGHSCQFPLDNITSSYLRSLLCFYDFSDESWRLDKPIFNNLKLLRVLDLEGADIGEGLPKDVGELIHLRFLSLRHAKVSKIPSSVGNLRYLQTLDLLITGTSVDVPNVIWKMKRLRHLYLPELCICDAKTKLRLDNLTNLRTLVNFPAQNCDVRDLFSMTNLRELTIREPISINNFPKFLKSLNTKLKHLRALSLDNSYEEDDREAAKFKDLRSMSFGDFTVPSI